MIATYARVSTQEQAQEGYSINEQKERLWEYCNAMGWKDIKHYSDAGYSGSNMNRPALQELISDIGKIDRVVVMKLDRLSRSQFDTLYLIESVFLPNGVEFVSMSENFDTSSPFGKAMIGMLSVFAQLEREQIKERMQMGRSARSKDGLWHGGGHTPVGYDYTDGKLVVNAFEAMQVRQVFQLYLQGKSLRGIAREMTEKGFFHKYGKWSEGRVRDILKNRLYIGEVKFSHEYHQGIHEPIVDKETFDAVQFALQTRTAPKAITKNHALLAGLIYCKRCGARYAYAVYPQKNGKVLQYYQCHSRTKRMTAMVKDPSCKNKNYRMDALNSMILGEVRKLATDPEYIAELVEQPKDDDTVVRQEIEKLKKQRSRLIDLYSLGTFTADELQDKIEPLTDRIRHLTETLEESSRMPIESAQSVLQSFSDVVDTQDTDRIRLLLLSLIDRIEIDGDDIDIHWKFS